MRTPARLLVLLALAFTLGLGLGQRDDADAARSAQDRWKAAHAERVVQELRARDVGRLTLAQQAARERMLAELLAYGRRGRFAQNEDHPGEAIPHLIDRHGTRCALANLIDVSGHPDLLLRLSAEGNTAFVPAFAEDAGLGAWLGAHGLSLEEAAYIQGPGFVDPGRGDDTDFGDPMRAPTTGSPRAPTTGSAPAPTTPTLGNGRRRRAGRATTARWDAWWRLNRHAFLNLRARYHEGLVVTGEGTVGGRGYRPDARRVGTQVIPVLEALATGGDKRIRATALMAWARAARHEHAPKVIAATKAYVGDKQNQWRELMLLALGIVRHEDGVAPLASVLGDTAEGRVLLAKKGAIPERTRAYAAVALGQSGRASAVAPLRAILEDERSKSNDLKACTVMALGTLARDLPHGDRRRIAAFLVKALRGGRLADPVAAMVPAALRNTGDDMVLGATLLPILERFRPSASLRAASALAMGAAGVTPRDEVLDTLIATARRDPEDDARRFGILALGEVAAAQPRPARDASKPSIAARRAAGRKLVRYYEGAFAGRNIQKSDMPWLCISAALFARGYPEQREAVRKQLESIATRAGAKDRQAAAIVALGLLGDASALPTLRALAKKTKDKLVHGYVAETRGILGDTQARDDLLAAVKEDGSGTVRYQAALGLGFTADPTLSQPLVDILATTASQDAKRALARVLGELGDRRALTPLLDVARDEGADVWTRRRALGAVGMIAQEADHAWTTAFQRGVHWTAATPTLREILALF